MHPKPAVKKLLRVSRARVAEAANFRPAGYEAAVVAAGTEANGLISLTPEAYADLARRFPPIPAPRGLGDVVASVATPIARALGLGCLDPKTKQLRPESGCAQRKAAMNQRFPLPKAFQPKKPAEAPPPT